MNEIAEKIASDLGIHATTRDITLAVCRAYPDPDTSDFVLNETIIRVRRCIIRSRRSIFIFN